MRSLIRAIATCAVALAGSIETHAMPVYLRLDSRFPSGYHSRSWLEGRTQRVEFQNWLRVETRDRVSGWMPEDHLLTPLRLASIARLKEDTPPRRRPQLSETFGQPPLKQSTRVLVLEIAGSWARTRPLPAAESQDCWIPSRHLDPVFDSASPGRAFVHTATPLLMSPTPHARRLANLKESTYVPILNLTPQWIEVRSTHGTGFIPRQAVWVPEDLGSRGVRPLFALAPLRSQPVPYSEVVRTLGLNTALTFSSEASLRWGNVKIPDTGDLWWPMSEEREKDAFIEGRPVAPALKLSTEDVFKRKIFDMASSRAIPSLKFVSAQGLFRTTDGQTWSKIPVFQDRNYPIAIARGGAVFIGPYVSEDHGETFQQWIRWDSLVANLDVHHEISARNLQILEIKPEDSSGRRLVLKLNLGLKNPVKLITYDQGMSWRQL